MNTVTDKSGVRRKESNRTTPEVQREDILLSHKLTSLMFGDVISILLLPMLYNVSVNPRTAPGGGGQRLGQAGYGPRQTSQDRRETIAAVPAAEGGGGAEVGSAYTRDRITWKVPGIAWDPFLSPDHLWSTP